MYQDSEGNFHFDKCGSNICENELVSNSNGKQVVLCYEDMDSNPMHAILDVSPAPPLPRRRSVFCCADCALRWLAALANG